jgi:hypothetical protein
MSACSACVACGSTEGVTLCRVEYVADSAGVIRPVCARCRTTATVKDIESMTPKTTCEHATPANVTYFKAACETCKAHACDDCAEQWAVCQSCGGGICETCTPSAQSRRVNVGCRTPERTERLCGSCAARQGKARLVLISDLCDVLGVPSADVDDSEWLDQIVSDIESAIKRAKKEGDI